LRADDLCVRFVADDTIALCSGTEVKWQLARPPARRYSFRIMPELSEFDLIVGTIEDINGSIEELQDRIDMLVAEHRQKVARLEAWKKKLLALEDRPPAERKRQPKGANLRAIAASLENAIAGLSASEIREKTGLAWSSVQRVLTQHPEVFVETNGLWKLWQRTTKSANGIAAKQDVEESED
jgi:hypothetical protein